MKGKMKNMYQEALFKTYGPQNVADLMHNFGNVTLNNISAVATNLDKTQIQIVDTNLRSQLRHNMTDKTELLDTMRSFLVKSPRIVSPMEAIAS